MNKFYKIEANADETKAARLELIGTIGSFIDGFNEQSLLDELRAIKENQPLDVFINSPGGSVDTAIAIKTFIEQRAAPVTIIIAGLAASAATIVTCSKNAKVIMPLGSLLLIHPVRMYANGLNKDEMAQGAENLEKIHSSVRAIYAAKTGLDNNKLDELMSKESFLTAKEAVELGFADELDNALSVENKRAGDVFMLGGLAFEGALFKNAPKELFENKQTEVVKMTLEEIKAQYPDIVATIEGEGAAKERARIQAIEDISFSGHAELVRAAKFENGMSAEQLAVAILKAEKTRKAELLSARVEDSETIVSDTPAGNTGVMAKAETEAAEERAFINAARAAFNS